MMKSFNKFRTDEDGAVTVDWVVLTAAVVGLAVAAYSSIQTGATELTGKTSTFLGAQDPALAAGGNIQGVVGGGTTTPATTTPATTTPSATTPATTTTE
ncbi:hypothetical protein CEP88_00735 [Roseobacter denitrificans]|uniref:Flp pilus assembly protein, pilin Flp n=1 Tax=Roseobacter denitrificans (strain ATCC 33942 / OCh 114) TaxID=375451 RepID=Q167X1_ROSDO|nr:hypothetical protein [Roseobacter denitrificans]ABG31722.1 hypothetical protein RD1_2126 [Roseobacter denitrificans OCh 114]AVL51307.1 hypothetical protein CEP88_00735 [Roseobacter denitrificans]SFF87834.1 hypothetical protein SAMN05443635_103112 [Roseobacter denitrificans OCh 114]